MSIISIDDAVKRLTAGDVVAIPTETVYGLAGRIDSESALRLIFQTKRRPFFDPLIVHVPDRDAVTPLVKEWPEIYDILVEAFWPGPLTLIAPKSDAVSDLITSGLDTVALRCPKHPIAQQILVKTGVPLAAPSANLFGKTSPTRSEHVESEFNGQVAVVEGGPSEVGVESTVLGVNRERKGVKDEWVVQILRPGGITRSELRDVFVRHGVKFSFERTNSPRSPGHLEAHYQPASPVFISQTPGSDSVLHAQIAERLHHTDFEIKKLILPNDPRQAARSLYSNLRRLSGERSVIVIEQTPQSSGEEWEAIWDRLQRASSGFV